MLLYTLGSRRPVPRRRLFTMDRYLLRKAARDRSLTVNQARLLVALSDLGDNATIQQLAGELRTTGGSGSVLRVANNIPHLLRRSPHALRLTKTGGEIAKAIAQEIRADG